MLRLRARRAGSTELTTASAAASAKPAPITLQGNRKPPAPINR